LLAAREDSERLLRMINDLLDLAKLESGGGASHSRTVMPAKELVTTAVKELKEFEEARGIKLNVVIDPELPSIAADPNQLVHVFSNFVTNAAKFAKTGEKVTVRASAVPVGVRFSVIDNGPGIAPEHHARLFERFYRIPGSDSRGAGLGLAIAKEIVTAQGGTIGVKSAPGSGSEFYFDLPAVKTTSSTGAHT